MAANQLSAGTRLGSFMSIASRHAALTHSQFTVSQGAGLVMTPPDVQVSLAGRHLSGGPSDPHFRGQHLVLDQMNRGN